MRKNALLVCILFVALITGQSCKPHHGDPQGTSQFISEDTANLMLSSYLASINAPQNDTDLHCLILNADSLRAYLSNPEVADVKIMFAHTTDFIRSAGIGANAGYKAGALTVIVAGYDAAGNYVYYHIPGVPGNLVMDHATPCPHECPHGTAANNLLQGTKPKR